MRLIDADELKEWIEAWFDMNKYYHPYSKRETIPTVELLDILDRIPTVDPVKHGRWIYYEDETIEDGGRCSVCGGDQPARWVNKKWQYLETKYCPYCGAYMMGGDEE